jgi:hypothetical protein
MDVIFCERKISFLLMRNSADSAQILEEVLGEADALIRRLLEDRGVEVPHLVIAVTWNGRSSCAATSVRMPCGPRRAPDQLCLCVGLTW